MLNRPKPETGSDTGTAFTFRVRCDETLRISSQLASLATGQVYSEDSARAASGNKRKGIHVFIRKFRSRKRTGEKKRTGEGQASVNTSKQAAVGHAEHVRDADEANTTFATEDLLIDAGSDSPLLDSDSPTTRKRKRFAGIWEDLHIAMELSKVQKTHAEKRARAGSINRWEEFKENVGPSSNT